jgi:L-threonylcarbamoyladenylate synthase
VNAEVRRAAQILGRGGLVAFPTETVYGLGANAQNPAAVRRIFELKERPPDHPVIVHLDNPKYLHRWAREVPEAAQKLAARFWPGPLTMVLPRSENVHDVVTGGQDTVAIRVPSHPMAQQLLTAFGGGIAAPSANRFGHVSATTAQHVADEFGPELPMILDGGPCQIGIESTIVDFTRGAAVLLRPGAIGARELAEVLGYMPLAGGGKSPRVSGSLASHYAPKTEARLVKPFELAGAIRTATLSGRNVGVLSRIAVKPVDFTGIWRQAGPEWALYARSLYAELRLLDASGVDLILVEEPPAAVDWQAINDRLHRATHAGKPPTRGGRRRS